MRWHQFFVAVATIICNADFFASVLEYTMVAPLLVVAPIEGPACFFQPVGALVPPELYRSFGIASQNLANTFSSTSSIFIDDGPSRASLIDAQVFKRNDGILRVVPAENPDVMR